MRWAGSFARPRCRLLPCGCATFLREEMPAVGGGTGGGTASAGGAEVRTSSTPVSCKTAASSSQAHHQPAPEPVRHNILFLRQHGRHPRDEGRLPCGDFMTRNEYHDMITETCYMKGSQDVERIEKFLRARQDREAEHEQWSRTRFKTKATAAMFGEMQDDFARIMERRLPSEQLAEFLDAEEEAKANGQAALSPTSKRAEFHMWWPTRGMAQGKGETSADPSSRSLEARQAPSPSAPGGVGFGAAPPPGRLPHIRSMPGLGTSIYGAGAGGAEKGAAAGTAGAVGTSSSKGRTRSRFLEDSLRLKAGTRGLPPGFKPCVPLNTLEVSNRRVMIFPQDRCFARRTMH